MKLRYLLCSIPSLSMAADASENFSSAFDILLNEQILKTKQAVCAAEELKTAINMLPETLQSQRNNFYSRERYKLDELKEEEEKKFQSILKLRFADHAVLSCPNEYLSHVIGVISEESAGRWALSKEFDEEKQAIQSRLADMQMQSVLLSDESTLSVRKSVLDEIFMHGLKNFGDADTGSGKIKLQGNINPKFFRRLVEFLTHKKSEVRTEAPALFQAEDESHYYKSYSLLRNHKFLSLLHSLSIDSLQGEIEIFGNKVQKDCIFSCQDLCQLGEMPEPIYSNLTQLVVDFSDNTPYCSDEVNASILALAERKVKVLSKVKASNLKNYKNRISLINELLSNTLIPVRWSWLFGQESSKIKR